MVGLLRAGDDGGVNCPIADPDGPARRCLPLSGDAARTLPVLGGDMARAAASFGEVFCLFGLLGL